MVAVVLAGMVTCNAKRLPVRFQEVATGPLIEL